VNDADGFRIIALAMTTLPLLKELKEQ